MSAEKLYDEIIMDHIKHARNYRELPEANRRAQAVSQLCGDSITVYLRVQEDRIDDVSFQCVSCGISMASASMMTESVLGRHVDEAREIALVCQELIEHHASSRSELLRPEQIGLLQVLQAFPARKTCALVAWHALAGALRGEGETISV